MLSVVSAYLSVCLFTEGSLCDNYPWCRWSVTNHIVTPSPDLFKLVYLGSPHHTSVAKLISGPLAVVTELVRLQTEPRRKFSSKFSFHCERDNFSWSAQCKVAKNNTKTKNAYYEGGCLPQGCVSRGMSTFGSRRGCLPLGLGGCTPPDTHPPWAYRPSSEQNYRQMQKHYLPATSFAGGKNSNNFSLKWTYLKVYFWSVIHFLPSR